MKHLFGRKKEPVKKEATSTEVVTKLTEVRESRLRFFICAAESLNTAAQEQSQLISNTIQSLDGDEEAAGHARQPEPEPECSAEPEGSAARSKLDAVQPELEPHDERAALIEPTEEQSAEGVGRNAVPGVKTPQLSAKRKKPRCLRCQLCLLELKEMKIRDFRLSQFLGLAASVVMLTADVWMDWALVIKWFLQGDTHWATTGLAINLLSGTLFGVPLALAAFVSDITRWQKALAAPAALLLGMSGFGPVAAAIMILYDKDNKSGPKTLKMIAGVELLFEALPQSILQ